MAGSVRISIPVAYNVPGSRIGGLNYDDEPVGFIGQFSPSMKNMIVERTKVRKRQGYTRLGTGDAMSGIGCALVNYTDALGAVHLIAFTTTNAYEYNSSSDEWDEITDAAEDWSGDADDRFSFAVVTDTAAFTNNGGSALVVTNNVEDLKYYEGHAANKFDDLPHTFTSFASCIDVVEFWSHMMVLGYTDTAYRSRSLGWSAFLDIDDWDADTSGVTTLTDTVGAILRAEKLGYDLMIYSERSISRCQYAGTVTIFVIPTIVQEAGLIAGNALSSVVKAHYFLGTDQKVYAFYQGGSLTDIGKRVDGRVFSLLDLENKTRIAAGYDVGRKKAMFFVPTTGEDYATKGFVVNTDMEGLPWEYYEFADTVRGFATLRRTKSSAYCDDTEWTDLYCDELPGYCDDKYGQTGYDMSCFITSDGYVMKLDESTGYDNGSDISCEYQTEDITTSDEEDFARFLWLSFVAKSDLGDTSVYVYYSTDEGSTWTALVDSPVTIDETWETHRVPLDVTSRRIRFKFVQSGFGDLQLRSKFKLEVVPSTNRD